MSADSTAARSAAGSNVVRPRVAIVVDVMGWAFARNADQLRRHLRDSLEIDVFSVAGFRGDLASLLVAVRDYDLVHFMWRGHLAKILSSAHSEQVAQMGWAFPEFAAQFHQWSRFSTAVYDHLFLGPDASAVHREVLNRAAGYYTSSERLQQIYSELPEVAPPRAVAPDGVDLKIFRRAREHRSERTRPLVVGWSGNSAWFAGKVDFKGLHSVVKPAIELLGLRGVGVELVVADRNERRVPMSLMPEFYGCLDVYVCSSLIEGTPKPVLEAMASGIAVVSTDVGIVPEALGPLQSQFIIERSPAAMADALETISNDAGLAHRLGAENLQRVEPWDWQVRTSAHGDFFGCLLDEARGQGPG